MLRKSFVLLDSVRSRTEKNIWSQGIKDWNDFLGTKKVKGISLAKKDIHDRKIQKAKQALRQDNSDFFANHVPFSDQWRLYDEFKDQAVFLDIETSGYYGSITVVGLYDGYDTKMFIRGYNLDKALLENELKKYKLLVTFNGASFDMPVIKRYFNLDVSMPHVDLRFVCQKIGLNGGLKAIERRLGIRRRAEVEDIVGEDAVYLWEMWKSTRKKEYLDKLIMYNEEDIINLKPLAKYAIPRLWDKTKANIF